MLNLIKTDLNIICRKKGFFVALVLVTAYALFVSLYYAYIQQGFDVSELYHPAILSGLNADVELSYFFCKYYPFIVVMPAAFVMISERKSGMNLFIQSRQGLIKYYISKLVAGFLATLVVFTFPFFLELILNVTIFPLSATKSLTNWETFSPTYFDYATEYFFGNLFLKNVYLYFICSVVLFGVFSGCAAVFCMGISSFNIKFKAFMFLPVYLLLYVTDIIGGYTVFPTNIDIYITAYDSTPNKKFEYYIFLMAVMMIIGVICVFINIRLCNGKYRRTVGE